MVTIPHDMYPHIVEAVIQNAPWDVKLAFRLTSKYYLDMIDNDIFGQVMRYRSRSRQDSSGVISWLEHPAWCPLWAIDKAVLVDDPSGFDSGPLVFYERFSERWRFVLEKHMALEIEVSHASHNGNVRSETTRPVPWQKEQWHSSFMRTQNESRSVPLPFGTVYVVESLPLLRETASLIGRRPQLKHRDFETPCTNRANGQNDDWAPEWVCFADHIVTIDIDPYYEELQHRLCHYDFSWSKTSPAVTTLWLFFQQSKSETSCSDGRTLSEACTFEDSFVGNIIQKLLRTTYYKCTLIGLESLPPQLLGLNPEFTKPENILEIARMAMYSVFETFLWQSWIEDDNMETYASYVSLRSLADVEADPAFKEILKYQKTVTPPTNSNNTPTNAGKE